MSTVTANLGLFKYNTDTDGSMAFNINQALNNNWDIIDNALTNVDALPDQTDKAGYILTTNGSEASWGNTQEIYPCISKGDNSYGSYRKYSDGWIEQYGYISRTATKGITFTLPTAFTSTNYIAILTFEAKNAYNSATTDTAYIVDKQSSQITFWGNVSIANFPYFFWYACGF